MRIGVAPLVSLPPDEGGGIAPRVPRDGTPWSIVSADPRWSAQGQALVLLESRPEQEAAHAAYGFAPLTDRLSDLVTLWAQRRGGDGTARSRLVAVSALRAARTAAARKSAHRAMLASIEESRASVRHLRGQCEKVIAREVRRIEREYFVGPDAPGIRAAIIASDGFSGTAGTSLSGRAMDAAGGGAADVWALVGFDSQGSPGAEIVASDRANRTADQTIAYDNTASAIGDQYASCVVLTTVSTSMRGPAVRVQPGNANRGYSADTGFSGGTPRLWLMQSTGYSFFGSGGTVAAGDTLMCEMEGTTGTAVVNGVDQCSGTSAAISTGVGGIMWFWAGLIDDWVWGSIGSAATAKNLTLLGVG